MILISVQTFFGKNWVGFFDDYLVCFILRNHEKNPWSLWFRSISTKTVLCKFLDFNWTKAKNRDPDSLNCSKMAPANRLAALQ